MVLMNGVADLSVFPCESWWVYPEP